MMKSASYLNDINEYYKTITGKNNNAQEEEIIYRGNSDTKVFHQPNCQYYSSKNCTVIFRSRDEAVKKGYVPCNTCKP
jgi:methylphosphotriester-DNA--protein-cysteine methyltransferase